ncbi:MAG: hypothetical protein ACFFAN_08570 [Promethearchaeota archaeon]
MRRALDISQQTASRRLIGLEKVGWIKRKIRGKKQIIQLTEPGKFVLFNRYNYDFIYFI